MKKILLIATLGAIMTTAYAEDKQPVTGADTASFEQIDSDRDGRITRNEAASFSALEATFDSADANQDGVLTEEEFARGAAPEAAR